MFAWLFTPYYGADLLELHAFPAFFYHHSADAEFLICVLH